MNVCEIFSISIVQLLHNVLVNNILPMYECNSTNIAKGGEGKREVPGEQH